MSTPLTTTTSTHSLQLPITMTRNKLLSAWKCWKPLHTLYNGFSISTPSPKMRSPFRSWLSWCMTLKCFRRSLLRLGCIRYFVSATSRVSTRLLRMTISKPQTCSWNKRRSTTQAERNSSQTSTPSQPPSPPPTATPTSSNKSSCTSVRSR